MIQSHVQNAALGEIFFTDATLFRLIWTVIFIYDNFLTLPTEVRLMWRENRGAVFYIFLLAHYGGILSLFMPVFH